MANWMRSPIYKGVFWNLLAYAGSCVKPYALCDGLWQEYPLGDKWGYTWQKDCYFSGYNDYVDFEVSAKCKIYLYTQWGDSRHSEGRFYCNNVLITTFPNTVRKWYELSVILCPGNRYRLTSSYHVISEMVLVPFYCYIISDGQLKTYENNKWKLL